MSNFENALRLNLMDEVNALQIDNVDYTFSAEYEKNIKKLFDKMRGDKYHILTKKASVLVLVAAILFTLVIVGFAATRGREYLITAFSDHYEYNILEKVEGKKVRHLELEYTPVGFNLENESGNHTTYLHKRYSNGESYFDISKGLTSDEPGFDSQVPIEEIEINGVTYVYFGDNEYSFYGLLWNNNGYLYYLTGNIPKSEMLNIAQNCI